MSTTPTRAVVEARAARGERTLDWLCEVGNDAELLMWIDAMDERIAKDALLADVRMDRITVAVLAQAELTGALGRWIQENDQRGTTR